MWLRRRSYCVLRRVVNTVRFSKACLFATLVLPMADLRGASTGREVAHHLAYLPRGHAVTAVTNPAPLTQQEAPQDPRQDLASGRVESGQKRNGTADGIC